MIDHSDDKTSTGYRNLFERFQHSDTLIIATIPIMAYLLVFAYDLGYLAYFKLPTTFMSFKINDVLISIMAMLALGFIVYNLSKFLLVMTDDFPFPIRYRLVIGIIIPIIVAFAYIAVYFKSINEIEYILLGILIYMLLVGFAEFILPIIQYRKIKGYVNKLIAQDKNHFEDSERNKNIQTGTQRIIRMIGLQPVVFLLILFFAYHLGRSIALGQDEFYILNTIPEKVVLWMTDEYIVCSPFNRDNNVVERSFTVIKVGEVQNLELTSEHIGRLTIKPITNSPESKPAILPTEELEPTVINQQTQTPVSIPTRDAKGLESTPYP